MHDVVGPQAAYVLALTTPGMLCSIFYARNAPHFTRGGPKDDFAAGGAGAFHLVIFHLFVSYVFSIAYYSRCLPIGLGWRGLPVLMWRVYSRLIIFFSLFMFILQFLWLVSAYYFNPQYVTFVLSLCSSVVGMGVSFISAFNRFLLVAEQRALQAMQEADGPMSLSDAVGQVAEASGAEPSAAALVSHPTS